MNKNTFINWNVKLAKWEHKQRHHTFDNTAIPDRLRTVSWSNYMDSHPTDVVNQVYKYGKVTKYIYLQNYAYGNTKCSYTNI